VANITDVRGTAFVRRDTPSGWMEIDSSRIDQPGKIDRIINPYLNTTEMDECEIEKRNVQWFSYEDPRSKRADEHKLTFHPRDPHRLKRTVIRSEVSFSRYLKCYWTLVVISSV
jgi:hypothetical protein